MTSKDPNSTPAQTKRKEPEKSSDEEFDAWEIAATWTACNSSIQKLQDKLEKQRTLRDKLEKKFAFLGQLKGTIKKAQRRFEEEESEEEEEVLKTPSKSPKTKESSKPSDSLPQRPSSTKKRLEEKMRDNREKGKGVTAMVPRTQDMEKPDMEHI